MFSYCIESPQPCVKIDVLSGSNDSKCLTFFEMTQKKNPKYDTSLTYCENEFWKDLNKLNGREK